MSPFTFPVPSAPARISSGQKMSFTIICRTRAPHPTPCTTMHPNDPVGRLQRRILDDVPPTRSTLRNGTKLGPLPPPARAACRACARRRRPLCALGHATAFVYAPPSSARASSLFSACPPPPALLPPPLVSRVGAPKPPPRRLPPPPACCRPVRCGPPFLSASHPAYPRRHSAASAALLWPAPRSSTRPPSAARLQPVLPSSTLPRSFPRRASRPPPRTSIAAPHYSAWTFKKNKKQFRLASAHSLFYENPISTYFTNRSARIHIVQRATNTWSKGTFFLNHTDLPSPFVLLLSSALNERQDYALEGRSHAGMTPDLPYLLPRTKAVAMIVQLKIIAAFEPHAGPKKGTLLLCQYAPRLHKVEIIMLYLEVRIYSAFALYIYAPRALGRSNFHERATCM
ncbi:hypothetical protein B0H13DRAFT_1911117 [Mycena leptocephala]|nr:hypothetical protein B0H13DRAFT_1911117 [Mycena leptocephala]